MSVQVKGSGTIGGIDEGLLISGITTSTSFHASTGLHFTSNNGVIQTGSSGHMLGIQGGATNMGGRIELRGGNSTGDIRMYAQGTTSTQVERLRIDSNGKIGVGGAPSAWQASTISNVLQLGTACIFNYNNDYFHVGQNFYWDGSNYKYVANDPATRLLQDNGQFTFYQAPSGSADANITWTDALHIDSNGDIGINISTINRSDTGRNTIQFDYSGSDGSEGLEIRLSNSALNGNAATDNAAITYIGQNLGITNRENGVIKFNNNGDERLRIDSSGRVSIGDNFGQTSYPFYVAKDLNTSGTLLAFGNTDSTYSQSISLNFDSNKDMKWSGASGSGGLLWSVGTRGYKFEINGTERFRLDGSGRMGINAAPSVSHEYLHIKPVGNNVLDLRYELNSDTDIRHKFFDNTGTQRGTFGYTTYANNSTYPNFHDSFYLQTDPGSNGTLATALWVTNTGQFIKPLTYQFFVETSGTSVSGGWTKLTGLSPDSTHCTGVSNGTYWSNSNSRFTAPVSGTYNFFIGGFSPTAEGGGTNHRYMYLFRINGGNYKYGCGGNYSDNNTPMAGGAINYKLTVNDYVEVWYYSAISATWGNSSHRFFWGGILLG